MMKAMIDTRYYAQPIGQPNCKAREVLLFL